jgi:hypothetical protein
MSNGFLPRTCSSRSEFAVKATGEWNRRVSGLAQDTLDLRHARRLIALITMQNTFDADKYAIDGSQGPAFPAPPSNQNRGRYGQYAR